ncbi:GNAT family N-acetyltransferase [Paraglaciecola aquimarina]|uniref:GNAT family N-acetyltransferase n=1 Tax=Paraglaciecola aquimarina TaxID=1235557 RepID=A0ABU3SSE6_9ALTE|nr:GNAT family N-acetyltransferase [Paraglaciecola aquimarina]MDU0352939.1 GNAT family N-acetyltransferase [Paraglaciecola aquimarina]
MHNIQRFQLQAASIEDAAALSELAIRSKGYWDYTAEFLKDCQQELTYTAAQIAADNWCFVVAKDNTTASLAGFYALHFTQQHQVELSALFVSPCCIGEKLGKQLFEHAISNSKKHHCSKMQIQSDPFAEGFYLSQGAIKVGEAESQSIPGRFLPLLNMPL